MGNDGWKEYYTSTYAHKPRYRFCDIERLMMRKIIICSLIDVLHEETMEYRMSTAIQTIMVCSRDNCPICCKVEKFPLTRLAFSNIGG